MNIIEQGGRDVRSARNLRRKNSERMYRTALNFFRDKHYVIECGPKDLSCNPYFVRIRIRPEWVAIDNQDHVANYIRFSGPSSGIEIHVQGDNPSTCVRIMYGRKGCYDAATPEKETLWEACRYLARKAFQEIVDVSNPMCEPGSYEGRAFIPGQKGNPNVWAVHYNEESVHLGCFVTTDIEGFTKHLELIELKVLHLFSAWRVITDNWDAYEAAVSSELGKLFQIVEKKVLAATLHDASA